MAKKAVADTQEAPLSPNEDFFGDIGNFDLPELDTGLVDFIPADEMEETRYTLPKLAHYSEERFVLYDNAVKLAKAGVRKGVGL